MSDYKCFNCSKPVKKVGEFGWVHLSPYDFMRCGVQGIPLIAFFQPELEEESDAERARR